MDTEGKILPVSYFCFLLFEKCDSSLRWDIWILNKYFAFVWHIKVFLYTIICFDRTKTFVGKIIKMHIGVKIEEFLNIFFSKILGKSSMLFWKFERKDVLLWYFISHIFWKILENLNEGSFLCLPYSVCLSLYKPLKASCVKKFLLQLKILFSDISRHEIHSWSHHKNICGKFYQFSKLYKSFFVGPDQ